MKNLLYLFLMLFSLASCSREDFEADDFPQEEITNVILNVKDLSNGATRTYNYSVGGTEPSVLLEDGKTYEVGTVFLNGNENITQSIINARDEHFLIFNFPNSEVGVTRTDAEVRSDGKRVGITTRWEITKVAETGVTAKVILSLIHDSVSVNEAQNGTEWGSSEGGETDVEAAFTLIK